MLASLALRLYLASRTRHACCRCWIFLRPRRLVVRNAFSRNGFVFDRNFFEILKISRSRTPEDLVLEWFRRRNGPDGQVEVGIDRSKVQYQGTCEVQTAFFGRLERSKCPPAPNSGCVIDPGVTTGRVVCEISLQGICFRSKFLATQIAAGRLFLNRISRKRRLGQEPEARWATAGTTSPGQGLVDT